MLNCCGKCFRKAANFKYENPNPYLYTFTGSYEVEGNEGKRQISLDHKNFILRGCSLRNTRHVIGLVAYTGLPFFIDKRNKIQNNKAMRQR